MTARRILYLAIITILCLAIMQLPAFAASSAAERPNLLVNGGMEGQYVMQCSARGGAPWVAVPCGNPIDFAATFLWQTAQVPAGWTAWWQPPNENPGDPNFYNGFPNTCPPDAPIGCAPWHNPEFRDTAGGPQTPSRKVAGENSQKYFTFYSLHEAGLYQTVGGLKPGQRVRFSVYMQAWSSADNDPFRSAGQPTMGLKVGIDPFGGDNPWSPGIVWSPVKEAFDRWEQFTVEAVAQSDRVTVFTRSRPYFAIQHNDVYVDEASLVVIGTGPVATARATTRSSAPAAASSASANFRPGQTALVGGTGGLKLRIRTAPSFRPGTQHVSIVPEGAPLVLVEGPRVAEGFRWWRVREPQSKAEGWVAQKFLRPAVTPTATAAPKTTATPRASSTPKATATLKATGTPKPTATPPPTATPRQPLPAAPNEYVVQPGESLVLIARKFGLVSADLIALNPQLQPPRYYVYPGQIIRIRP